jgi:hypothetical protein
MHWMIGITRHPKSLYSEKKVSTGRRMWRRAIVGSPSDVPSPSNICILVALEVIPCPNMLHGYWFGASPKCFEYKKLLKRVWWRLKSDLDCSLRGGPCQGGVDGEDESRNQASSAVLAIYASTWGLLSCVVHTISIKSSTLQHLANMSRRKIQYDDYRVAVQQVVHSTLKPSQTP